MQIKDSTKALRHFLPMSADLNIKPLEARHSAQSYPLAQMILPQLSLSEWLRYVEEIGKPNAFNHGGIVAAYSKRGYIHGLFAYVVGPDALHGKVLMVDNFIAFEIPAHRSVTQALLSKIDTLARCYDCRAAHVQLPAGALRSNGESNIPVEAFEAHGHNLQRVGLCKQFEMRPPF